MNLKVEYLMNNPHYLGMAVRLCSADLSCGFISLDPVLGSRDELTYLRLTWYCQQLQLLLSEVAELSAIRALLPLAVELTCADIVSTAIAVAPVLYDRDEKINERLRAHLAWLAERVADETETEVPALISEMPSAETVVRHASAKKGKKKKRRH